MYGINVKNDTEINSENNNNGVDLFTKLPNEIIVRVFRFLDYRSLTRMPFVCKKSENIVVEHLCPKFEKYQLKFADLLKEGLIEEALKYIKNHPFPTNYPLRYVDGEDKLIERTSVIHMLCQYFKSNGDNENLTDLFHLCLNANADLNFINQKKTSILLPFPHISFIQQTPLLYAINADKEALFDLLIKLGANINLGIDQCNNPLTAAINRANGGNLIFLLRLLEEPSLNVSSYALIQVKDKSSNYTWRIIYLRMLKAYILQQSFALNAEEANIVNADLERIDELYQQACILSSEENQHHATNAELLQFQNEVNNIQEYVFELGSRKADELELAEPISKKAKK